MLTADRERTAAMNLNLVVMVCGVIGLAIAFIVVDFQHKSLFSILLLLTLLTLVAGSWARITFDSRSRAARLRYMSHYGALAESLIKRSNAARLKPQSARHRYIAQDLSEIIGNMYGRITGERVWVTFRQVYSDGSDLWVHDVLKSTAQKGVDAGHAGHADDVMASPVFRAIWARVRQASHPYYVCGDIEKEWKSKTQDLGRTAEEVAWPGFYSNLVSYFGRRWSFPYRSMVVIPIGGVPTAGTEGDAGAKIMPWGYMAVMSDVPKAFSDPAVRDLGQRCAGLLAAFFIQGTQNTDAFTAPMPEGDAGSVDSGPEVEGVIDPGTS